MNLARRLARLRLLRPVWQLLDRLTTDDDRWHSVLAPVSPDLYGQGNLRDFSWYLEGDSAVAPRSLDEICDWLLACEYASDHQLFNVPDFWQHPVTFEQLRRGDCEDFALWAWRHARSLGLQPELVAGRCRWSADDTMGGHVWVVLHAPGPRLVLDGVRRDRHLMVQPLDAVRELYEPHASVDSHLQRRLYAGYVQYQVERQQARRAREGAAR